MSKVKRSTYQKVVEENKRLINDIRTLVDGVPPAKILCSIKWKEKFKEEREFQEAMKEAARLYVKKHTDKLPDFLTNKY